MRRARAKGAGEGSPAAPRPGCVPAAATLSATLAAALAATLPAAIMLAAVMLTAAALAPAALGTALGPGPSPAFAAPEGSLELFVRGLPDGRLEVSCLAEFAGVSPDPAAARALIETLQAGGLQASEAAGGPDWVLNISPPGPVSSPPGLLGDGVVIRYETNRYGPVTVFRAFMSLGGPDGFLKRLAGLVTSSLGAQAGGVSLAAMRLQLPGRVVASSAPARAGDILHWDVESTSDTVLFAEASSFTVAPFALLAWTFVLALLGGAAWFAVDMLVRSARARHHRRF